MTAVEEVKGSVTKFSKLKPGDICSETQYYTVVKTSGDKVQIKNDNGTDIVVDRGYVESCLKSANQFTSEKNVNMTEAAAIFLNSSRMAITVNFNKQVKEADVVKEIMEAYASSTPKEIEAKVKKSVKSALTGVERTIVGRHYGELNDLGRVQFVDMETERTSGKDYDTRLRLVDPRTINFMIVNGIKYTIK